MLKSMDNTVHWCFIIHLRLHVVCPTQSNHFQTEFFNKPFGWPFIWPNAWKNAFAQINLESGDRRKNVWKCKLNTQQTQIVDWPSTVLKSILPLRTCVCVCVIQFSSVLFIGTCDQCVSYILLVSFFIYLVIVLCWSLLFSASSSDFFSWYTWSFTLMIFTVMNSFLAFLYRNSTYTCNLFSQSLCASY